ncbi:uncharacterized protein PG986_009024 [Apiospora aurea]|uniref:Uncharacterized protein n=1 Tax=Apiospora aurea TaxID=335848 RepID=A0ABR1Q6J2_9PEZI
MFFDKATNVWYLLTSADHNTVQINKINSDGSIGSLASTLTKGAYEAPSILVSAGVYFLLVSGKTGYRANANQAFWAPSPAGPWTGPSDIAPPAEKTYGSQNTYAFAVEGSRATTHVYMGDAWDSKGTAASNYVWLPVAVEAGARKIALQYYAMWRVDPGTGGRVVPGGVEARCLGDDNVCAAPAPATDSDNNTKQQRTMVRLFRTGDEIAFRNVTGRPGTPHEWVSIRYTVNDPDAGEAYVKVNDQTAPVNLSEYNSRAGYHHTVPVRLRLDEGDVNTITLGAVGAAGFEMEVEGLELHEDD